MVQNSIGEMASHTHEKGTMEITGSFTGRPHTSAGSFGGALTTTTSGAFTHIIRGGTASHNGVAESSTSSKEDKVDFQASRSWTGETSLVGANSSHNNLSPFLAVFCWKRIS